MNLFAGGRRRNRTPAAYQARSSVTGLAHLDGVPRDAHGAWRVDDSPSCAPDTQPSVTRSPSSCFRAIFDAAPDGMVILGDDRRYVDANRAACRLLCVDPGGRLVGRRIEEFVLPALGDRLVSDWGPSPTGGEHDGEYELRRPDGEHRTVALTTTPDITPGYHLVILRDVTQHKKREKQRARELQALMDRYEQIVDKLRSTRAEADRMQRMPLMPGEPEIRPEDLKPYLGGLSPRGARGW